ncbi:MAG: CsiV family protein [Porticoccaceae bacterium]
MNSPVTDRDYQQNSSRLATCLRAYAFAMFGTTVAIHSSIAQEADDPQLLSWYQVEVVIFTQQGYAGSEQPPRKYSLDFPENILQLLDTDYIGNNYPVIDINAPEPERAIPVVAVEDPALAFASPAFGSAVLEPVDSEPLLTPLLVPAVATGIENDIPAAQTVAEEAEPEEEQIYTPRYEKPFIKLDRELRDLNDSARALDRRAKYNVVFHEAWRFAADKNAADPWVLIKAGKQFQDRFEIEGSLRFYKSRFLHFQSDLWLASFSNETSANKPDSAKWIELPAFPAIPEPSLSDGQADLKSLEVSINEEDLENFFFGATVIDSSGMESLGMESSATESIEPQQEEQPTPPQPTSYPVSSLWVFDQSKRLEEQQSYYLDHPKMGILVNIKPHEVEITNPLEEELEPESDTQTASN